MSNDTATAKPEVGEVGVAERTRCGCEYRPNVDILEKVDELVVVADVPGAAADSIDVDFKEGMLSIHAPVPQPEARNDLLREYGVGDYYRTFRVSEAIDASKISAEYSDGVLTLHLPKVEAAKPRKISVGTK
ncbi:MAG: Hsp20/alpha crystallin family protein [Pirellulales bacterium]|nr:Hsp20/alpha crystallin family protein [Pirellulales bacterium]